MFDYNTKDVLSRWTRGCARLRTHASSMITNNNNGYLFNIIIHVITILYNCWYIYIYIYILNIIIVNNIQLYFIISRIVSSDIHPSRAIRGWQPPVRGLRPGALATAVRDGCEGGGWKHSCMILQYIYTYTYMFVYIYI